MVADGVLRIVGLDLASQPKGTAAVWLERDADKRVSLRYEASGVSDGRIRNWLEGAGTILGIDAPFGWPQFFADHVAWWQGGGDAVPAAPSAAEGVGHASDWIVYRMTDRFVRNHVGHGDDRGRWPTGLSVSTNWIAYVTLRLVGLVGGQPGIDRSGMQGPVLEVYPAAALGQWRRLPKDSYKRAGKSGVARSKAEDNLRVLADWLWAELDLHLAEVDVQSGFHDGLRSSDHLFDAAVAALCAWASLAGCSHPPDVSREFAPRCTTHRLTRWTRDFWVQERRRPAGMKAWSFESLVKAEGWIHHPSCPPSAFLGCDPRSEVARRVGAVSEA